MTEQSPKPPSPPTLASVEADWIGTLFGFHMKTMTLLRESSLDDEKMKIVADRINTLLDDTTAEMKRTQQLNIKERLEAAYDEVKRLVDELSGLPDGGRDG
jgi:hypothetical protein